MALSKEQRQAIKEVTLRCVNGSGFLHTVMFDHPKEGKVFGTADTFCDEAFGHAKEGRILVRHIVYPSSRGPYSVKAEKITALQYQFDGRPGKDSLPGQLGFSQWGACPKEDYCALEGLAHEIRAERNKGKSIQVNDMFSIGVGDGSVTYVVTRVAGNRCDVEWRGMWNADSYIDHHYGWGRQNCSLADVGRYVSTSKSLPKLFASTKINKSKAFESLMKEYEANHGFPASVEV